MDFRAAYLPDKYWHRRSVVVPKRPVVLDKRFHTLDDLFRDPAERENFEIYWVDFGVAGNVRLPGELNYAYIDGKFYHLERVNPEGFVDNAGHDEPFWSYYLEYDDWQNEWLNNRVHIRGTISKTGDWELARQHIVQLAPLVTGISNFRFFTGGEAPVERRVKAPERAEYIDYILPQDLEKFNELLGRYVTNNEPDRTRLTVPLGIRWRKIQKGEQIILKKIKDFLERPDLKVYDVKKDVINFSTFKTKYKLNRVFSISTPSYHTFEISQTENQHAKVKEEIDLSNFLHQRLDYLNTDLTPYEGQENFTLDELVDRYLQKYPNVTTTGDKADFKFIAWKEIVSVFKDSFFYCDSDEPVIEKNIQLLRSNPEGFVYDEFIEWPTDRELHVFLGDRLKAVNGIYQPGTEVGDIRLVIWISEHKTDLATKYTVGGITKTAAQWYATNNWSEFAKWADFLSYQQRGVPPASLDFYYIIPADEPETQRHNKTEGNVILYKPIRYRENNQILLIPDYRSKGWVLGQSLVFYHPVSWIHESTDPAMEAHMETEEFQNTRGFILELGETEPKGTPTWTKPKSDDFLKNSNKRWSKYGTIIPLLLRWANGYPYGLDSYNYKFFYELTKNRWRKVKEEGENDFENKRLNFVFQFPLQGCGFNIWEILKDYRDINDRYIRWNFICSDEMKQKHGWEDKGGEFDGYYDLTAGSDNMPSSWANRAKNKHMAFDEIVEVRVYSQAQASKNRVHNMIWRFWVYYFGWRWDGSYNGALLLSNYGSDENGFLEISWAKPHNRHWYRCSVWISNGYGGEVGVNAEGDLLYGYYSRRWNAKKKVFSIGYKYANDMSGYDKDVKDILTCNVRWIKWVINSDGDTEDIDTFSSDPIDPVKFSHLFRGDKPWENLSHQVGVPLYDPFGDFSLGDRLKDRVKSVTIKTIRTINPKEFNPFKFRILDYDLFKAARNQVVLNLNNFIIPYYIFRAIDPNAITSRFHGLNFTENAEKSLEHFRTTIRKEVHNALTLIHTQPFIFDIRGTEFICVAKVNPIGDWEIELISKSNESIETEEAKHHTFPNPQAEEDTFENFVRRLNSQFEVSVYGQRIPIKTRPDTTKETLDIGLKITPINDPKQSNTSNWYMVEIKAEQDTQRMRIEVAKELTAMNIEKVYEREHILRTMAYHSKDRNTEQAQYKEEVEKYAFDIDLKGQRLDIDRNKEIAGQVVGFGQSIFSTITGAVSGFLTGGPGGGIAGIAGGIMSIGGKTADAVFSRQLYQLNRREHAYHAAHGERALMHRGELMRSKHETAQLADKLALYNMQTNIAYPTNSDALMFRVENAQFNLADVHLTQYFPDGKLLEFLCNYYREYGFNVIVPNQLCLGADWIKGHIQFVKITSNVHENETIRRMIEERALAGITLEDNDDWHADQINDLRDHFRNL